MAGLPAFTHSPAYAALVSHALDSIPPDTFKICPGLKSSGSHISVMGPLQFAENGYPVAGAWKHSYPVSGCGPDTILNFYFIAKPNQTIDTIIGIPGSTRVGPVLQRDAEAAAIAGATASLQEQGAVPCPNYTITNSSFQAFGLEDPPTPDPGASDRFRPWWENWTVAGCGRAFLVPLDFIPHPGTPIEINRPGHVTQVRLQDPTQDAPNPYALPEPKPSGDAPASDVPSGNAPSGEAQHGDAPAPAKP
jgi:hypothetical protein